MIINLIFFFIKFYYNFYFIKYKKVLKEIYTILKFNFYKNFKFY